MDRFAAMTAFVTVVDRRGFAPAARQLGLSPSAVTRMVAALEERLATRLLQRTTRSLALTVTWVPCTNTSADPRASTSTGSSADPQTNTCALPLAMT